MEYAWIGLAVGAVLGTVVVGVTQKRSPREVAVRLVFVGIGTGLALLLIALIAAAISR